MYKIEFKSSLKFALRLCALLFISLTISACTNNDLDSEYEDSIERANAFYENNAFADAINESNQAAKLISNRSEAYSVIAKSLAIKDRGDDLDDMYLKVEENLDSKEKSKVYFSAGEVFYENAQWQQAWDNFSKSYENDNSRQGIKFYALSSALKLGKADFDENLLDGGEKGEFSNRFEKLKVLYNSELPEGIYEQALKAREYLIEGYPYLAIRMIEPTAEKFSEYDDGLSLLGRAYYEFGDFDKCLATLSTLQKADYESKIVMGRCAYENNDYPQLAAAYKNSYMLAEGEQKLEVVREFVSIALDAENITDANEILTQFANDIQLEKRPLWLVSYDYQVQIAQGLNEKASILLEEAGVLLADSAVVSSEKIAFYEMMLMNQIESGNLEEGKTYSESLEELMPISAVNTLYKGAVLLSEEKVTEAKELLNLAIDYDFKGDVTVESEKLLSTID